MLLIQSESSGPALYSGMQLLMVGKKKKNRFLSVRTELNQSSFYVLVPVFLGVISSCYYTIKYNFLLS